MQYKRRAVPASGHLQGGTDGLSRHGRALTAPQLQLSSLKKRYLISEMAGKLGKLSF